MYADALKQVGGYDKLSQSIKDFREKKKLIEITIQNKMGKAYERLLEIKNEVKAQKEMMNDIAIKDLMDGKTVELVDAFDNKYEPVWSVKFKKVNEIKK